MSDINKAWNKTADTANYYKDRAASKVDETKATIEKELNKTDFERKVDNLKEDIRKTVNPTFWDRNKDNILIGSAVAAGSLLVLLAFKK